MATLRKRGKIYYVDYSQNGKRERKRVGPSKKTAETVLKDIEVKLAREESGLFVKEISFQQFLIKIESYFKTNLRDSTKIRYTSIVNHFNKFLNKSNQKLSSISPSIIEEYKAHRIDKISKPTVNTELKLLKLIFNLAVEWGYLKENPLKRVRRIPDIKRRIPRYLTEKEASLIITSSPYPYADIFTILLLAGMRRDELRFLEVSDINLKRKEIKIHSKKDFMPKTGERTIPINDELMPIIKRICKEENKGYLFKSEGSQNPHSKMRWYKKIKTLTNENNLNISDVNVHTFRHTFCSWLVMANVNIRTIKELAGHSDINTTLAYSHLSDAHISSSINKISLFGHKDYASPKIVPKYK